VLFFASPLARLGFDVLDYLWIAGGLWWSAGGLRVVCGWFAGGLRRFAGGFLGLSNRHAPMYTYFFLSSVLNKYWFDRICRPVTVVYRRGRYHFKCETNMALVERQCV
jgi:hypothetical protein